MTGGAVVGGVVVAVVVGGVVVGGAVVVVVLPVVAITGLIADPDGVLVVMPVGAELLAYALHVSANGLPDTSRVKLALESSSTVMVELVAVKGPRLPAGSGRFNVMPSSGTGFGKGALNEIVPLDNVEGVAP